MLTNRQKTILNELMKNKTKYLTSIYLSDISKVSLRTVKTDILAIKTDLLNNGANIEAVTSKGFKLIITDYALFDSYMDEINTNLASYSYYAQSARVSHIMRKLINNKKSLYYDDLANELFISRSSLSNDIKIVKSLFSKYCLDIKSIIPNSMILVGNEENIRQCVIKENLLMPIASINKIDDVSQDEALSKIKNVLLESFVSYKIIVSDFVFQNLIVHIYTSLWRMKNNHYIEDDGIDLDPSYRHIQLVSNEIMRNICRIFGVNYSKGESNLLAINIQGKRELFDNKYITKEIDDFVANALKVIKKQYNFDFLDDLNLRISLALHVYPLISRIKSNLQIQNKMKYEIKQNYILPFDIASTFCYELSKKYNVKVSEDETSYIALHFLNATKNKTNSKKLAIALISSEKKSNTFIIRQKFNQWFGNNIITFDIYSLQQIEGLDMSKYDAVFSTDKDFCEKYGIVHLDLFLNESHYQRIEFAINGYKNSQDFMNKFSQDLYFTGNISSKEEIISFLCDKASKKFALDKSFYESILEHEKISTSYFGHGVVLLHPKEPMTNATFIAVLVLNKPVIWDDSNETNVAFLVSVEKNNPKALALWYYLSFFISNQKMINDIIKNPSYSFFYDSLSDLYNHIFGSN